jgi:SHS family lactate transporter-like MFS transporter
MKPIQGLIWFTGWSAWTVASLQFYLLPFTLSNIAKFLDVEQSRISEVNTYTLLSRSVGAIIFGVLSDQYGRKIPLLIDLVCLGVLSLSSGFIHTYSQLIGVRLLFGKALPPRCRGLRLIDNVGIAYGGVYGLVMASVLESVPRKARGIVGGFTQQGFAAGYLLASGFHLAMCENYDTNLSYPRTQLI